ncbi:MAG: hypothetical protein VCD00_18775 [Candidatus Hydrogenedentota bacterium]
MQTLLVAVVFLVAVSGIAILISKIPPKYDNLGINKRDDIPWKAYLVIFLFVIFLRYIDAISDKSSEVLYFLMLFLWLPYLILAGPKVGTKKRDEYLKKPEETKDDPPHPAYKIIDNVEKDILQWADEQSIQLHRIEYVAVFEFWNDHLGIRTFFETKKDAKRCRKDGTTSRLEQKYMELPELYNYPFDEFPSVSFDFDSHENVVR